MSAATRNIEVMCFATAVLLESQRFGATISPTPSSRTSYIASRVPLHVAIVTDAKSNAKP
jgi:hypothetical protein